MIEDLILPLILDLRMWPLILTCPDDKLFFVFSFFLMRGRQEGDVSTCAELKTFFGENRYLVSVGSRNCVISAAGFILLKKTLLILVKALKKSLGKCGWKRTFPSSHHSSIIQFPH